MAGFNKKSQDTQETATFDTVPMGFKKTQVNLYINSLKKQIIAYEKQINADKEKIDQLNKVIENDPTEQYEQRIQELNNVLNKERQGIEAAEADSKRFKEEADKLRALLEEKDAALKNAEKTISELSSNPPPQEPVVNDFFIEDEPSDNSLLIDAADTLADDDDLSEIVNEDFNAPTEDDLGIEVDDSFFILPKRHSENAIDFGAGDDFSDLLSGSSDDLVISSHANHEKGEDLILSTDVADKGNDLTSTELQSSVGRNSKKSGSSKSKKNRR